MTTLDMPRHKLAAAEVRAAMARLGHQQKDLAVVLGVSNAAASEIYRGIVPITLDRLDVIAAWLRMPLSSLLGAGANVLGYEQSDAPVRDVSSG